MKLFDNINTIVRDDLAVEISSGSRISIATACFSIYAYQELKQQLEGILELRFIFTSPTFVNEKIPKEKREFYIPRLNRERSLYGNEFEVKLRNELTQKAVAKECAEWIKRKVTFKSNITNESMSGFISVESNDSAFVYSPINGFTTVDIGCERGNNVYNIVNRLESPHSKQYLTIFDSIWKDKSRLQDVTELVLESITNAYKENSAEFIYFITLYNIFRDFLDNTSIDDLPNEATGFKNSKIWSMLYDFQKDAVLAIISKLEKYNGCILADSVGLGKTFTALAVIKYYENRNKSVLVLCPKKLNDNWKTYKENYLNNPLSTDRFGYTVLFHTDLSRSQGKSNGIDLDRLNWGNFDLVVIDESHNFRNGGNADIDDTAGANRYTTLLNKVIRRGVKTKVLMLSATPVNNRFYDLKNQLALAYEGNSQLINEKLNTSRSVEEIFKHAQKAFNSWNKQDIEDKSTESLLKTLEFDFFELLDSVTIARSRKHIEKYYNIDDIGKFPQRLKPITQRPKITENNPISYNDIFEHLNRLNLSIYTPSLYIQPSKQGKYDDNDRLSQRGREAGMRKLMSINLLKRLESSVHSFRTTVQRVYDYISQTINIINNHQNIAEMKFDTADLDLDDQNIEFFVGKKIKIDLADMNYEEWRSHLQSDATVLNELLQMTAAITPDKDNKLQTLIALISDKISKPINEGNKKVLVFTAFTDTADYLYEHISPLMKVRFNVDSALVTGETEGKSTIPQLKAGLSNVLTYFSPKSKDKTMLAPDDPNEIDILIATDCISEGQNLQDCDYLVNFDIHWNPVRIIQRFGRIDRIGSKNSYIQMVNFWPDLTLDEYIDLRNKVESRMRISVIASTGDDDLLNVDEKGDLQYRKKQLERLQREVVDLEDMSNGISILDLGLNEFRLDLLEYLKTNPEVEHAPHGMHAVVDRKEIAAGVIYVLKNINNSVNVDEQNRLHPYYLVYIGDDGNLICDHLSPKKMLDTMRYLCKGNNKPITELCNKFNAETDDGGNMKKYSELLSAAITQIINKKDESDIDSLFQPGGTKALVSDISGLDDFELISFFVIR